MLSSRRHRRSALAPRPGQRAASARRARSLRGAAFDALEARQLFALLGVGDLIESPRTFVDVPGQTTYDAGTGVLHITAFAPSTDSAFIDPPAKFDLTIRVDTAGNLIGSGDANPLTPDLIVSQDSDNNPATPDVVLLTANIRAGGFGWEAESGQTDYRLQAVGGTWNNTIYHAPGQDPKDVGMILRLVEENLSFASSFSTSLDESPYPKGEFGPIPAPPTPPPTPGTISGFVYCDCSCDGVKNTTDEGIANVKVQLFAGNTIGGTPIATAYTDANGKYTFTDLAPGTYTVYEVQSSLPANYQDRGESLGTGATSASIAGNDRFLISVASAQNAVNFNFAEFAPASINGFVYLDWNDDGTVDFGEDGVNGVKVALYKLVGTTWKLVGYDQTDCNGFYQFGGLCAGTYAVTECQPCGLDDGKDTLGTVNGKPVGSVGNDSFCNIKLDCGDAATNYNFGEKPPENCGIRCGQTASACFWANKNGQALLRALNGGATATALGNWLAGAFPNLYGNSAVNFAGKTNDYIAKYFANNLYNIASSQKVDAQVLSAAFATYVTSYSLSNTTIASKYGFTVSTFGVGVSTINVGKNGAAFGVANYSTMTVMELLVATDKRSWNGKLFDANRNGITESLEATYRSMANSVFTAVNDQGDCSDNGCYGGCYNDCGGYSWGSWGGWC